MPAETHESEFQAQRICPGLELGIFMPDGEGADEGIPGGATGAEAKGTQGTGCLNWLD